MRELLKQKKAQLQELLADRKSAGAAKDPKTLASVDGILNSAAKLGTGALVYWAAKSVGEIIRVAKQGIEDYERDARNGRKARQDLEETKKRQDEQDTEAIRQQVHKDLVDRAKKNLPPAPKSIRGHWEGHVFIPKEQPAKAGKPAKPTKPKSAPKAARDK